MYRKPYVLICICDFAGQIRGKGTLTSDFENRWIKGVGWTPTNIMINCFGQIPSSPWGASGDLIIVPDPCGELNVEFDVDGTREHFVLGYIQNLDGSDWECCPRAYLRSALAELKEKYGLLLRVAFEHEFTMTSIESRLGGAYGIDPLRQIAPFPEIVLAAAEQAELEPETFHSEFSSGQFELTLSPAIGMAAADRATKIRHLIKLCAGLCGHTASLSPIMAKDSVGNGVHIHFSLEKQDGTPISYDASKANGVSEVASHFVAGILEHGRALTAITAPSVISYERLRPNAWSASLTNLGSKDREALVRICPVSEKKGADVSKSFNFEYRAADSAASPYLALGALVRAGIAGLDNKTSLQKPISAFEANKLTPHQLSDLNIEELPQSLEQALTCLEKNEVLMSPEIRAAYIEHKRGEIKTVSEFENSSEFEMYAKVY